jgi:hypothetical protein
LIARNAKGTPMTTQDPIAWADRVLAARPCPDLTPEESLLVQLHSYLTAAAACCQAADQHECSHGEDAHCALCLSHTAYDVETIGRMCHWFLPCLEAEVHFVMSSHVPRVEAATAEVRRRLGLNDNLASAHRADAPLVVCAAAPPEALRPALPAGAPSQEGRRERRQRKAAEWASDPDHGRQVRLLTALVDFIEAADETLAGHRECPGCDLCYDADGMSYAARIYLEMISCTTHTWAAPEDLQDRLDRLYRIPT